MHLMSKISAFARNGAIKYYGKTFVFKMLCVVIGFINSILINRCLGVALRGDYTTITNLASLLQLFLNLGIGSAYPALKRREGEKSKDIFTTLVLIVSFIYVVIVAVLFAFLNTEYRYVAVITFFMTLENLLSFVGIVEDVSKRNKINFFTLIVHAFTLAIVLFCFKNSLNAVLLAVIFDHFLLCACLFFNFKIKKIDFKLLNKKALRTIFAIATPSMLMNLLMYLNYHADVLFLSYMIDDSVQVGLYGTAVTLGNILWKVPDAFKEILYNRAAKKDNPEEVVGAIVFNMFVSIAVLIGFAVLGKWFLRTMYGEDFVDAYSLVLMMFIGTMPMTLYKLIHPIYIANGKTKIVVVLLLIAVLSNFTGNILLIPAYKAVGAAISTIISYAICGVAFLIRFNKDYKISFKSVMNVAAKKLKRD